MRMTLLLSCRCQQLLAVFLRSPIEPYPRIWTPERRLHRTAWKCSRRFPPRHRQDDSLRVSLDVLRSQNQNSSGRNGTRATVDDTSHPPVTTRIIDIGLHERVRSVTSPGTNESVGRQRKADFLSNIEESVWPTRIVFHCGSIGGSTATIEASRSRASIMRAGSSALRVSSLS